MSSRDFIYWLQGLLEIGNPKELNEEQLKIVKNHLNLVFKHEIDPSLNEGKTKEEVIELQDIHDGKSKPKLEKPKLDFPDWLIKKKDKPPFFDKFPSWRPSSGFNDDKTILRC